MNPTGNAATSNGNDHQLGRIAKSLLGPFTFSNVAAWTAIIAAILAIRIFLFDVFYIPSGSMEPTLRGSDNPLLRDYVLVNKRAYSSTAPERWDVVVFRSPEPTPDHPRMIKRVAGLPGERVLIRNGDLIANGAPLDHPESMPDVEYTAALHAPEDIVEERLALLDTDFPARAREDFLWQYRGAKPFRYGLVDDDQFAVVPERSYFMLGDNSAMSVDGRYYGWVRRDRIIGEAVAVIWPPHHWRDLSGFAHTVSGKLILWGLPLLAAVAVVVAKFARRKEKVLT